MLSGISSWLFPPKQKKKEVVGGSCSTKAIINNLVDGSARNGVPLELNRSENDQTHRMQSIQELNRSENGSCSVGYHCTPRAITPNILVVVRPVLPCIQYSN
jgi:hypothetical protein